MAGDFYGETDVAAKRRAKTYAEAKGWTFMSIRSAFDSAVLVRRPREFFAA